MTRAGDTVEARLQRSLERENTVDADKTCGFSVPGKATAEIRPRRESPRRLVSKSESPSADGSLRIRRGGRALFDPDAVEDPLVRQAMKEPVAFFGGMFAGFLGLSVDDEASPLSKWVRDTSEAAGARREGPSRAPAEEDAIDRTSAPSVSNEGATRKTAAPSRADEEGESAERDVAL